MYMQDPNHKGAECSGVVPGGKQTIYDNIYLWGITLKWKMLVTIWSQRKFNGFIYEKLNLHFSLVINNWAKQIQG